jgi:hypothetical protein
VIWFSFSYFIYTWFTKSITNKITSFLHHSFLDYQGAHRFFPQQRTLPIEAECNLVIIWIPFYQNQLGWPKSEEKRYSTPQIPSLENFQCQFLLSEKHWVNKTFTTTTHHFHYTNHLSIQKKIRTEKLVDGFRQCSVWKELPSTVWISGGP